MQRWGLVQSPSCGGLDRNPSLHGTRIRDNNNNNNNNNNLGEEIGRQAWSWRSSSPKDPGGAPASTSDCSQSASSEHLALEECVTGEHELSPTTHVDQLRSEVSSLQEIVGHLVLLIASVNKGEPNNFQLGHVRERACSDKLSKGKGAKHEDLKKGEHNRVDFPSNKQQQQLEQQKQKQLQEGQLRPAEPQTTSLIADKQEAATDCSNNNKQKQQTAACNKNSLGIGKQERPPKRPWRILVDTGAELSVAPRSFAAEIQLSPLENDLQLRTATGMAIETFGTRTVQLLCQGFSFTMSFVIADVEQPLLGLGSLLKESLSLHLDSNLGHHLGNIAGDKIQLEQRGLQLYLVACPAELGLTHCMIGNLLEHSLLPEAKNLVQEVRLDEGGAKQSLPLDRFKQHKQPKNKPAIGQQTALPKAAKKEKKKKGQQRAASKLRTMEKTRFIEKMQLALLSPEEDPKHSLDEPTAKDLSLRILLTLSLMKKWQLITTRVRTALPQEQTTSQLRELGLRKSLVHDQIFVGDQLCVMLHENHMLIGGAKLQQECFINKLSACMLLEDTKRLDDQTPLSFLGRSLEFNRAERSISLHLPSAFYLELLSRYGLEDATATSSPGDELESEPPRWNNIILDAERTKLYKQTVGDLLWSSYSRPDIGFAVQQLSNSSMQPTEHDEKQLVNVLRYLKGTQHYGISLQPPRRWERAKNLELLAFSATSWSGARRSTSGISLSFMGVPLAASTTTQATATRATEVESVRLACAIAFHTKILLQDFQLVQPMSFPVLTGGPLAVQLGLSKKERHMDLWSGLVSSSLARYLHSRTLQHH